MKVKELNELLLCKECKNNLFWADGRCKFCGTKKQ